MSIGHSSSEYSFDVEIPANAGIELILTQPITVNPASLENQ